MKTYQEYCDIYHALRKECLADTIEILNNRGVEYINVHAYTRDYDIDENPCIPYTDKNGYGVNCTIDAIYKENGKWYAELVDEYNDPFDTQELEDYTFDTSAIIDIYGMLLSIFNLADDEYNGRICGKGEDLDDLEEE